ncbi:MAG: WecB/TagA/CpsF family glycosyltransferase [Bacteroidota bacterium]
MERFNIGRVKVSAVSLKQVIDFLKNYSYNTSGYICLPDTYVIARAEKDENLCRILNNSLLTLPDGKPLQIFAKLDGHKHVTTVSGYKLILALLDSNLKHVFWGASPGALELISSKLKAEFPEAKISGFFSPPVVTESEITNNTLLRAQAEAIKALKPDLIWVGISSPKQDILMDSFSESFEGSLMLGVGGVFDYLAGTRKMSPEWVKKIGMRWLWRLAQEPGRLGGKYLLTAKAVLYLTLKKLFKIPFK